MWHSRSITAQQLPCTVTASVIEGSGAPTRDVINPVKLVFLIWMAELLDDQYGSMGRYLVVLAAGPCQEGP